MSENMTTLFVGTIVQPGIDYMLKRPYGLRCARATDNLDDFVDAMRADRTRFLMRLRHRRKARWN